MCMPCTNVSIKGVLFPMEIKQDWNSAVLTFPPFNKFHKAIFPTMFSNGRNMHAPTQYNAPTQCCNDPSTSGSISMTISSVPVCMVII